MGTLEEKVQHLEQQLNRILQHIGSPNGDLFAPYEKVANLEAIVQKQQIKLDLLDQTQVLFLQSVPQYLDEQVQQALQQRGSKGADFVAITKFVTGHLASSIVKLQEACFKTVHESLPLQAVQALEKKVQTSLQTPSTNVDLQSIQIRLALLETQPREGQIQQVIKQEHPRNESQPQELAIIKEHIDHLETKLLQEVQKAYNTVHKPGDMGLPLARLQSLVTTLNAEFQSFRQLDVRKLVETMLTVAHQNLRTEFTEVLETCISKKEYSHFEASIQRIEEYTKDIRGGFYKVKNDCDTFKDVLSERFSEKRWKQLNTLQKKLEVFMKGKESIEYYLREMEKEMKFFRGKNASPYRVIQPPNTYKEATKVYQSITKCFYTAIIHSDGNSIDQLGSVDRIPGWDYICFTNQPYQKANGWTIVPVIYEGSQYALEAKRYKWLSHEYLLDYDVVVWVDGYITPTLSMRHKLKEWILTMKQQHQYTLHRPHDVRSCIWDECDAVVQSKRDNAENVNKVRKLLEKNSMPKGWGLFDTNIFVRFHKQQIVQELGEAVYSHLSTTSNRDQLAVTFIYYKYNFTRFHTQDLLQAFQKNGTHLRITT